MKSNPLQMKLLLLPKKVNKMKMMIKIMRKTMIKGELSKLKMGMIKTSEGHHHSLIQELGKLINVSI
jgi:hypothetical protein